MSSIQEKKLKINRSGFLLRSPSLQKIKCSANQLQGKKKSKTFMFPMIHLKIKRNLLSSWRVNNFFLIFDKKVIFLFES